MDSPANDSRPLRPGKRIVILSDGTGNSAASIWRTNVRRTYEAIDLSGRDQVAFYDDGVGTSAFKPLAILGGAFGYGLKRNVIHLYSSVCRNYRPPASGFVGDEIYAFGFSRGAFTIRVVIGLILNQGLVQAKSEPELMRLATQAYRAYRAERFHTKSGIERIFRRLRAGLIWVFSSAPEYASLPKTQVHSVKFVGLWDTVAAYGLPIAEMTRGVSDWIWPLELPDHQFSTRIEKACHALALDDARTTFQPILWNETGTGGRLNQVWFAGMHANVGGGYPDDSLAYVPLVWMLEHARGAGLVFKNSPDVIEQAKTVADSDGRMYNSRGGLGQFYRYGPRKLKDLCDCDLSDGDPIKIDRAKIHESVFQRLENGARFYAPLGLPASYEIVPRAKGQPAEPYEPDGSNRALAQERIYDLVVLRKIIFFLTMLTLAWMVVFPFTQDAPASAEWSSPIRWVSDTIRLIATALPGFLNPWVRGYTRNPGHFVAGVGLLGGLLWIGSQAETAASNRMADLWRQSRDGAVAPPEGMSILTRLRSGGLFFRTATFLRTKFLPAVSAAAIAYGALALISHALYDIEDLAGLICHVTKDGPALARGQSTSVQMDAADICNDTGIDLRQGWKYRLKVTTPPDWADGSVLSPVGGFHSGQVAWPLRLIYYLGLPLRRETQHPWFRLVARYGAVGGEERFLDPDPDRRIVTATLTPNRDGHLFLFVNDAVLAIPLLQGVFYSMNNRGRATVVISRE